MPGSFRVNDAAWKELKRKLSNAAHTQVRVGVFADAGLAEGGKLSLAELMAIHEFGTLDGHVPERSSIRLTLIAKEREIAEVMTKITRGVVNGKIDLERGLNVIGAFVSSETKKTITTGPSIPPPLAPATIAAKRTSSSDPSKASRALIDTGRMVGAISWKIGKAS